MANTYTALHYHIVFGTKEREPWITMDIEDRVWSYLAGIADQHGMTAPTTSGISDLRATTHDFVSRVATTDGRRGLQSTDSLECRATEGNVLPLAEYRDRQQRLRAAMVERGIDAVYLAFTPNLD